MALIRVVLSDLDDTLFDHYRATRLSLQRVVAGDPAFARWTLDDVDRCHRELLERFHLEVLAGRLSADDARIARFQCLFDMAGAEDSARRAAETAQAYRQLYETCWHCVPGARALLGAAKSAGAAVVIVTNNTVAEQQQKLAMLGLAAFVDHLVTSEEVCCSKPDPGIFHEALARANASAADAVMLGDSWPSDVEGARSVGVRPVWLNRFGAVSRDPAVDEIASLEPATETVRLLLRNGVRS
jgi:HAD superfamily hydrolase (TIGR01549 family)